jgi:hypothetical protein
MKPPVIERLLSSRQEEGAARRQIVGSLWDKALDKCGHEMYALPTYISDENAILGRGAIGEPGEPQDEYHPAGPNYVAGPFLWPSQFDDWERTIRARDLPSVPGIFKLGSGVTFSTSPQEYSDHFISIVEALPGHEPSAAEFLSPVDDLNVTERFEALAQEWLNDTRFTSSTHQMVIHPAYQQIIGLGRPALPLLIRHLDDKPQRWFWALRCIAGEDPSEDAESLDDAIAAWRHWALERGYTVES